MRYAHLSPQAMLEAAENVVGNAVGRQAVVANPGQVTVALA